MEFIANALFVLMLAMLAWLVYVEWAAPRRDRAYSAAFRAYLETHAAEYELAKAACRDARQRGEHAAYAVASDRLGDIRAAARRHAQSRL